MSTPRLLVCLALCLAITSPAFAQASRLGASFTAIPVGTKGSAVAYDSKNSVYLVVSAFGGLWGQFLSADGALIGGPFVVNLPGAYSHFPGVAYSPDANGGAGGFLAAWHDSVGQGAMVHCRTIALSGSSPVLGLDTLVSNGGSWWEASVDLAYSTVSKEYLAVWQGAGIRAQRLGLSGELLGINFAVATDDAASFHRDPAVAYSPVVNEYMVSFGRTVGIRPPFAGSAVARRVAPGSGALLGAESFLASASAVYITDISYNSTTNQYLAAWYQPGGTYGKLLDASGSVVSAIALMSSRFTAYDAINFSYNPTSGTFMMVAQDQQSYEAGAAEISAAGVPSAGFVATATGATNGNYYPKVAARAGAQQWLMTSATNFAQTTGQRLQTGASNGPPPPPPCSFVVSPMINQVYGSGGTVTMNITTGSGCAWSAQSLAPYLSVTGGASGTGNGSVTVAVARNTSTLARTGAISLAGTTAVVIQAGYSLASLHDIEGDGGSDIVFHNQVTGDVAMWALSGPTVVATLNIGRVANTVNTNWQVVGTGDLNGDGFADLVWQDATSGYLALWTLRGSALHTTPTVLTTEWLSISRVGDPNWKIRGVGDVDGDGKADLVWQHDTSGLLAVWLMNGSVVVSTQILSVSTMPDLNWKISGAGDINGDGKADIIWQNQATGGLGAWLLNGSTVVGQRNLSIDYVADTAWKIRGVGDVNGDGFADLIWQNTVSGGLGVWYLIGYDVYYQSNLSIDRMADTNWKIVGPG